MTAPSPSSSSPSNRSRRRGKTTTWRSLIMSPSAPVATISPARFSSASRMRPAYI
jgi:hypothetical protein